MNPALSWVEQAKPVRARRAISAGRSTGPLVEGTAGAQTPDPRLHAVEPEIRSQIDCWPCCGEATSPGPTAMA